MKTQLLLATLVLISGLVFSQEKKESSSTKQLFEFEIESEYRYFLEDPSFPGQKKHFPSIAIRPIYTLDWNNGINRIYFEGFGRLDVDSERTHWDIREFFYRKIGGNWDLSLGLKKVFWGVTESNHLVDIINQTDAIESFDGERKLGQPMLHYALFTKFGSFDFFYLPYSRKRTFPGTKGRFRFPTVINSYEILYENSSNQWHQDFALRYSNNFNWIDVGLSYFRGTGREPFIDLELDENLFLIYPIINQFGLEMQITYNSLLWKIESIYRSSDFQKFFALTGGFEYTISNFKNSGIDIGLLGEYLYDQRGILTPNALQNDVFYGSRIAFNDVQDTSILIGGISDLVRNSHIFSIEASRRIGKTWSVELEGRILSSISNKDIILANFSQDSFLRLNFIKYF